MWGPLGGYLAALAYQASSEVIPNMPVTSFYCQYVSAARFDEVEIEVDILKSGRTTVTSRVDMRQRNKLILTALLTHVQTESQFEHEHHEKPQVKAPHHYLDIRELVAPASEPVPLWDSVTNHPVNWVAQDDRPAVPEYQAWFRFSPEPVFEADSLNAARVVLLSDITTFPTALRLYNPPPAAYAPNLDLNVQLHNLGKSCWGTEWIFSETKSEISSSGVLSGRIQLWSEDMELLASATSQCLWIPLKR